MSETSLQNMISEHILEEIKCAIVEGVHNCQWALVEYRHNFGRILLENEAEMPKNYVSLVSKEFNINERLIYQCLQFVRMFPDLDDVPGGKAISWRKIANELLPEHKEAKELKESREIKIKDLIKQFFKEKSIKGADQEKAEQLILEWENFLEEVK